MLYDLARNAIDLYKNDKEAYDKFFLDSYDLCEGIYFKFTIDNQNRKFIVKDIFENIDENTSDNLVTENDKFYKFFDANSFSNTISNKAIDAPGKKIYSTNVFSLAVKYINFIDMDLKYIQNNYLSRLCKHQKYKDFIGKNIQNSDFKNANKDLAELYYYIDSEERQKMFDIINDCYKNSYAELKEKLTKISKNYEYTDKKGVKKNKLNDKYIKFYINYDRNIIQKEMDLYLYSYIFLKNEYNTLNSGNEYVGLLNLDTDFNKNKNFLLSQTKKNKIPFLIDIDNIKVLNDVYTFIRNKKMNKIDIDFDYKTSNYEKKLFSYYELYYNSGIQNFDIVMPGKRNINFSYKNIFKFEFKNNINKKSGKSQKNELYYKYRTINTLPELKATFFYIFYNRPSFEDKLLKFIEISGKDISKNAENIYSESKNILHEYFCNGIEEKFKKKIDNILSDLIIEIYKTEIDDSKMFNIIKIKMKHALNFKHSFLIFFKIEEESKMQKSIDDIKNKLETLKEPSYKTDSVEEFCYLAGQVAYYLISLSETETKTFRMLEGVYNATNINTLKNRIRILYEQYFHYININNIKFKNALNNIFSFQNDSQDIKNYKDYVYAGTLSESIFYESNKRNVNLTNDENNKK